MRSAAWGLLRRSSRRGILVSPGVSIRQLHLSAPKYTSSTLSNTHDADADSTSFRPIIQPASITNEQLLSFLNRTESAQSLRIPTDITRIDAYLRLRETDPSTLAHINDDALAQLCMQAGVKRLGGVVGSLIDDLEGKSLDVGGIEEQSDVATEVPFQLRDANTIGKGGIFQAPAGSKRRLHAVQSLIIGTSRTRTSSDVEKKQEDEEEGGIGFIERLLSSSVLDRAFAMLMNDFQSLKAEQGDAGSDSPLPDDLDIRVARRLVRTISKSGNASLASVLGELIKHIKRYEADEVPFPQSMEGCYLLEYYISLDKETAVDTLGHASSPEMPQTVQAAYYILREMIAADPDIVSDSLVDAASREGHHYNRHLVSEGVSEMEASELGHYYTLRNIVINVLLKKSRYNMLQDRLQSLVDDISQTAARSRVKQSKIFYKRLIRSSINLALASKTAYPMAFAIAKRFPIIWPPDLESEGSGALLRAMCDSAVREDKVEDLVEILETILIQTRPNRSQLAPAAFFVGGEILIGIIRRQARQGRKDIVVRLLGGMRIVSSEGVVIDDAIDQLFAAPIRADFIAALAEAGLKAQSRALYERWGAPLDYVVDSTMVQRHIQQVVQTSISLTKPAGHETSAGSSEDPSASVKQSSRCLLRLIKLFAARPTNRSFHPAVSGLAADGSLNLDGAMVPHKHVQFAYHVLFQYLESQPMSLLNRKHFVRLASAYYMLDQRAAAFKCLGDIVRREDGPKIEEAVELLRLLSQISLQQTVQLLLDRITYWRKTRTHSDGLNDKDSLSRLYTPLLGKCLFLQRNDLAEKLMASARDNGLEEQVSMRALNGLVKYAFDRRLFILPEVTDTSSDAKGLKLDSSRGGDTLYLARWVKTLMEKEGWRPDPALLSWLIHKAVAANSQVDKSVEGVPYSNHTQYSTLNNEREAAIMLLSLSAKYLGYVDVAAASDILRSIQHKTYIVRKKSDLKDSTARNTLTLELDRVVKIVRWVQVLDYKKHTGVLGEEEVTLSLAPTGQAALTANQLSAYLFRFLIVAYLRLGDVVGASNVMLWAREEAKLSFEDLERGWKGDKKGFKNFIKDIAYQTGKGHKIERTPRDILGMFAGSIATRKTKPWWTRPESL